MKGTGKLDKKTGAVVTLRRLYRDSWAVVEIETGRVVQSYVGDVGLTSARMLVRELNGEDYPEDGLPDEQRPEDLPRDHRNERG